MLRTKSAIRIVMAALSSALVLGCGSQAHDDTGRISEPVIENAGPDLTELASVKTATGSTFEFYEADPGHLLVSGVGGYNVLPLGGDVRDMTLSAIYAKVAPGQTVPAAIVDADSRSATLSTQNMTPAIASGTTPSTNAQKGTAPTSPPGKLKALDNSGPPGDPNSFCSGAWAYDNLPYVSTVCNDVLQADYCWYDVGPGGGSWGNSVDTDLAVICNANSSSDVWICVSRNNGDGGGEWSVPSQSWRWWEFQAPTNWLGQQIHYNVTISTGGSWGDLQLAMGYGW